MERNSSRYTKRDNSQVSTGRDTGENLRVAGERLNQLNGILERTEQEVGKLTPAVHQLEANVLHTRSINPITEPAQQPETHPRRVGKAPVRDRDIER